MRNVLFCSNHCSPYNTKIKLVLFTNNLFVDALSGSALTLHDTNNCAVDDATCFADDISFSSLDIPCTKAFADSTKL